MIRRPPRSTLFPTRRSSDLRSIKTLFNFEPPATDEEIRAASLQFVRKLSGFTAPSKVNQAAFDRAVHDVFHRSEEHTSELQSPCNLVCRLLLEKKKRRKRGCRQRQPDSARLRRCYPHPPTPRLIRFPDRLLPGHGPGVRGQTMHVRRPPRLSGA